MKKYAGRAVLLICLALAGILMYSGARDRKKAAALEQNAVLTLASPVDRETVKQMRLTEAEQEKGVSFTAWAQEENKTVNAEATGRTKQVDLLWICGSSQQLLPYGAILNPEDDQGCLLDEETAAALFGSSQVEGMSLQVEGREWVIRGVFPSPRKLLILQDTREGEGIAWNRITVSPKPGQSVRSAGEEFSVRHGITGTLLRWDFYQNLLWLGELVPGKWSDFSGWSENIREKSQELRYLLQTEKSVMELEYLKLYRFGNGAILAGGFCIWAELFLLLGRRTKRNENICSSCKGEVS